MTIRLEEFGFNGFENYIQNTPVVENVWNI